MAPHGPSTIQKSLFTKEMLVGAVGIELKATLKTRKLLILLNEKNAKNTGFAQVRYTAGPRGVNSWRRTNDPSTASQVAPICAVWK